MALSSCLARNEKLPGRAVRGMSIELGRIGIWRHPSRLGPEMVAEVEALGYVAVQVRGPDPLPALRALAGSLALARPGMLVMAL